MKRIILVLAVIAIAILVSPVVFAPTGPAHRAPQDHALNSNVEDSK